MIILNEREYIENQIDNNELANKPSITVGLLARYNYFIKHMDSKSNIDFIKHYLESNYKGYNEEYWNNSIKKYVKYAERYPLLECDSIKIYESEMNEVLSIENKVLKRIYFTLLCLAKYYNLKSKNNNNWVNTEDSQIYKMACVTIKASEKDKKLNELKEMDLIEFSNKLENLNIKVKNIINQNENEEEKVELEINDFRKLGYELKIYTNEKAKEKGTLGKKFQKIKRCENCGIPIVIKGSAANKYCKDCAVIINREKTKLNMKNIRNIYISDGV